MGFEASFEESQKHAESESEQAASLRSQTFQVQAGGLHSQPLSLLELSRNSEVLSSEENKLTRGLSNLGSVYGTMLPEIPSAFAGQIKSDILQNPGGTALKFAESAALGLGTAVLLARSPVLAKTLLAGAGISASVLAVGGTIRFSGEALSANLPEEQARLALSGSKFMGGLAADLLETSPALILGAGAGYKLSSRIPALSSVSTAVRDFGELRARRIAPEGLHYIGNDAKTVSGLGRKAGAAETELNLLRVAEEMTARTPWKGIEEGRFFKIAGNDSIKMSSRLPGEASEVMMGNRAQDMFHTHEKALLPTSSDFNSVFGTGVIGVPQRGIITFYEGTGREAENLVRLIKSGNAVESSRAAEMLSSRTFNSLVVDPKKELAVRVDLGWNAADNRMIPKSIQPLDYTDTIKNLSRWNGKLSLGAMQTEPEALLKPGMTDLMRGLRY